MKFFQHFSPYRDLWFISNVRWLILARFFLGPHCLLVKFLL
jgi:hypothetical protein